MLPLTIESRTIRLRAGVRLEDDLAWLRAYEVGSELRCDCRCDCHRRGSAPSATGATPGSCGMRIDLDELDCVRSCRAQHILASECSIDEHRKAAAHV